MPDMHNLPSIVASSSLPSPISGKFFSMANYGHAHKGPWVTLPFDVLACSLLIHKKQPQNLSNTQNGTHLGHMSAGQSGIGLFGWEMVGKPGRQKPGSMPPESKSTRALVRVAKVKRSKPDHANLSTPGPITPTPRPLTQTSPGPRAKSRGQEL
jgi:hypothetical protein